MEALKQYEPPVDTQEACDQVETIYSYIYTSAMKETVQTRPRRLSIRPPARHFHAVTVAWKKRKYVVQRGIKRPGVIDTRVLSPTD
jgi:hypothetical protein